MGKQLIARRTAPRYLFGQAQGCVIAERTNDRLYIAEDNRELQYMAPNVLFVRTERGGYDTRTAVFDALRARPDRIIVGELRDGTALELKPVTPVA